MKYGAPALIKERQGWNLTESVKKNILEIGD